MKIGIILETKELEKAWNAFRFAWLTNLIISYDEPSMFYKHKLLSNIIQNMRVPSYH